MSAAQRNSASTRAQINWSSRVSPYSCRKVCAGRRRQQAPVEREVNGRIAETDVAPVDHRSGAAGVVDEQVPEVEVALHQRGRCGVRQLARVRQVSDGPRHLPSSELLDGGETVTRRRHAAGHGGRPIGSAGRPLGAVAATSALCSRRRNAASGRARAARAVSSSARSASSRPGSSGAPKNGHGKPCAGAPDEDRRRDRERKQRRETRQDRHLALYAGDGDLTSRKPERPLIVDDPDGVVPSLAEQARRADVDLRELLTDQRADEARVDDDARAPFRHRARAIHASAEPRTCLTGRSSARHAAACRAARAIRCRAVAVRSRRRRPCRPGRGDCEPPSSRRCA